MSEDRLIETTTPDGAIGVILVDHGSTRATANEMLIEVVALFKRVTSFSIVEPAHMELAEPTIAQAFRRCVDQGARMVVVHPYFLSPGRHSTTDIPRMVAEAALDFPGIRPHVTQPLGLDRKLAELISDRIRHCINSDWECADCQEREDPVDGTPAGLGSPKG